MRRIDLERVIADHPRERGLLRAALFVHELPVGFDPLDAVRLAPVHAFDCGHLARLELYCRRRLALLARHALDHTAVASRRAARRERPLAAADEGGLPGVDVIERQLLVRERA